MASLKIKGGTTATTALDLSLQCRATFHIYVACHSHLVLYSLKQEKGYVLLMFHVNNAEGNVPNDR